MNIQHMKNNSKEVFDNIAKAMISESSKSYSDDKYWQPILDKGNDYSVIRFLPAPEGEDVPFVKTFSHSIRRNGKWLIENCPTTINAKCPICDYNVKLWNTNIKENQDIVRAQKRRAKYTSNIYILTSRNNPKTEGRVFLYNYGIKIYNKLMEAFVPLFADEPKFNPFDFWGGANFKLKIREVEGFRNYDNSEFDKCIALHDDDDYLETIYNSEYSLRDLLSVDNFKSYADIEKRFKEFMAIQIDE